jgi:alkanesulfonate monooxygenase SsuD/methylene tetrahydromethanopterin reductase-like flavin-dependent oxidoreductase (luciferase family)
VLVGGSGERKTLRLVAQYADACNLFADDVDAVARKLDVLARHCEDVGRDPAEISRTVLAGGDPFDAGFLAAMESYAKLGVEQVWVSAPGSDPVGWVSRLTEQVRPRLDELEASPR